MKEVFAIVATIFALIGNISYFADVLSKRIKPHPYTWFVWTIVSGVTFFDCQEREKMAIAPAEDVQHYSLASF